MLSRFRHDLRTPVNAIIGYAEMWLEDADKLSPEQVKGLTRILEAGRRAQANIGDILKPEKIEGATGSSLEDLTVVIRHVLRPSIRTISSYCAEMLEKVAGANPSLLEDLKKMGQAAEHLEIVAHEGIGMAAAPINKAAATGTDAGDLCRISSFSAAGLDAEGADGISLLVVEDDPINRDLLARRLERLGYQVDTAENGRTALARLGSGRYDLVLLDIIMPDISGLEVLRQARQKSSIVDLPIIMATAMDEAADIVQALDLGANDYVTKPISMPVVVARIRTQLMLKQMVTALEAANRKLTSLSLSDGLTGIANRRAFDDYLQRELRRAAREKLPLALILIDIDDFKPYNDTYGHEAGDKTLRAVAHALEEAAERSSDMVARYGGEEFAVVLPHTDAAGAAAVAERMRAVVEDLGIAHSVSRAAPTVTISAGVACIRPNSLSDHQQAASSSQAHASAPQSLIDAADKALYRAKHAGRNQVQTSAGCTTG